MAKQKPIHYIPAREYTPGADKKYHSVFLDDLGENGEMFYLRLSDAEKLASGKSVHNITVYRQISVVKRKDEVPGIIGVQAEEIRDLSGIIEKLTHEVELQRLGGRI